MEDTTQLKTELLAAVKQAADIKSLEDIRVSCLLYTSDAADE